MRNGTMKKKDEHHINEEKKNTDQYHVKKYPGKRPQTVWGSGRIMYDNVDDDGDDDGEDEVENVAEKVEIRII